MDNCCGPRAGQGDDPRHRFGRVLWAVLSINAGMFVVEFSAGLAAGSSALLADSLDMLGDALLYAASLFVMSRPPRWQAGVALLKGATMAAMGLLVAGEVAWALWTGHVPSPPIMGAVGALALAANLGCAGLLYAYRRGDLNMRSSWLCSRNDVLANLGVLGAAALVAWSGSAWPDLVIGSAIAAVVLRDALSVMRDSLRQFRLDSAGAG